MKKLIFSFVINHKHRVSFDIRVWINHIAISFSSTCFHRIIAIRWISQFLIAYWLRSIWFLCHFKRFSNQHFDIQDNLASGLCISMVIMSTRIISLLREIYRASPKVLDLFIFRNIICWESFIPIGNYFGMRPTCAMPEKHFICRAIVPFLIGFYWLLIIYPEFVVLYLNHFLYFHLLHCFFKFFFYFEIIAVWVLCYISLNKFFVS